MTVINTNTAAITARVYATNSSQDIEESMERLSSGLRVNSGADDAAGLAVANKMYAQIRSTEQAMQNASNAVSLIQTAGSGMNKVNSMLIRMREVAVQMANGVYTDHDRANAQAEVVLLQEEIDKISENLQFNQVYLLDGSYNTSFRTGVSNEEVFNLSIISQRAEELGKAAGLKSFGTTIQSSQHEKGSEAIAGTVMESQKLVIRTSDLGDEMQSFIASYPGATLSISGEDSGLFTITQNGTIESLSAIAFDPSNTLSNQLDLTIRATNGTSFMENDLTLTIAQNDTAQHVKQSATILSVSESANISFRAVNSDNADDGLLSIALQEFVTADNGSGSFSISGGSDADFFLVDAASGVVSTNQNLDFESPDDMGSNNAYEFTLQYISSSGDSFIENITLNITNGQEEVTEYIFPAAPPFPPGADAYLSVQIDNQTIETGPFIAGATRQDVVDGLNSANHALSTPARVTFRNGANGIEAVFDNVLGNADDLLSSADFDLYFKYGQQTNFVSSQAGPPAANLANDATTFIKSYTNLAGGVNLAEAGDSFTYEYNGITLSMSVPAGESRGDFSIADLAVGLNAANSSRPAPLDIVFSVDGDGLVVSRLTAGATPAPTFGDLHFNGVALPSTGTLTTGTDSAPRRVVLDLTALQTGAPPNPAKDDFVEITIDGQLYRAELVNSGSTADIANDLNTELAGQGISVSASGDNLVFEIAGRPASVANAIDFQNLIFKSPSSALHFGINHNDGTQTVTMAGAVNNSAGGRDNSASGNGTDSTPTTSLSSSIMQRSFSVLTGANSHINASDNFTMSFSVDQLSPQLNSFIAEHKFGRFSLSGADSDQFAIDSFDGTLRTTSAFKAAPKESYTILVHYQGKDGASFSNHVTVNRIAPEITVRDSVADVSVASREGATGAITILDRAINQMAAQEATMGAAQNRLEHAIDYLSRAHLAASAAKGRILDADFAVESSRLSKNQILAQAATSMLAQANGNKNNILNLMR